MSKKYLGGYLVANTTSIASPSGDANFYNDTALLHGDGASPFNLDASTNGFAVAVNGDTKPNKFNPYAGTGYYSIGPVPSSTAYLSVATTSGATGPGTGDFTIEGWVYPTNTSVLFDARPGGGNWSVNFYSGGTLNIYYGSQVGYGTVPAYQWSHVAITRSSGTVYYFINGTLVGSVSNTTNLTGSTQCYIGHDNGGGTYLNSGISNFRLVIGTALYTASFTVPTTPLTAVSGTGILTCQSNRFIDNSTNAFVVTPNGDIAISSLQPFTAATTTYGSGYFDGSGDYLSIADNAALKMGSSDFTYECWLYPTSIPNAYQSFISKRAAAGYAGVLLALKSTGKYSILVASSSSTWGIVDETTISVTLNTWQHLAVVRSGSSFYAYLNGTRLISTSIGFSVYDDTSAQCIGVGDTSAIQPYFGYIEDARIVKGTALYTGASFTLPTAPLTAVTNTSLLTLQTRGPANNNGFLDSSLSSTPINRVGNPTQGSFSPYGSNWSNYYSAAYSTVPSTLALGSSNYTIEFWFCGTNFELAWGNSAGYAPIVINSTGDIYFADSTNTTWDYNVNGFIIKTNTWHHYAVVQNSGNVYIYRDGVRVGSYTPTSVNSPAGNVVIGSYSTNTTGYLSNFRCVIGTAVYTEAFTPPTTPLTAITNTKLLICQSNRFVDNSTNAYSLTQSGTQSVQRFSPFNLTTAYSPSVLGGSGYFDGSGDSLVVPSTTNYTLPGDFTIEFWAYPTSLTSVIEWVDKEYGLQIFTNGTAWGVALSASNNSTYYWNATASVPATLNAWQHVALVRSANFYYLFVNGALGVGTTSGSTPNMGTTNPLTIGAFNGGGGGYNVTGFICDTRITNTAVYTAAFTPPTAPLTAITGTTLLLNYTNAAMYDNAAMNVYETVANAKISTSVFKYGTGSMSFDGSSSYLQAPANSIYSFSTGNFTVEFWVYVTTYTATATTVVRTAGTSGWVFQFDGTNKMVFYANGAAQLTDSASPGTGVWTHFAVVRSGSTITMYRNGTSVASGTYATAINPTGVLLVGCGGDSNNASYGLNGYIDDLRITRGYARTISTPTAALPDSYSATTSIVPTATSAPGIWTLEQAAYYKKQGLWPSPP